MKIGKGIEPKQKPLYIQFGKYVLSNRSLDKNILNIKYPSLIGIKHLPKKNISQTFKELITNMIRTQELDKKIYNKLAEEEQDYLIHILYECGLQDSFGMSGKGTPYNVDTDRWTLLKGQVISGQNNEAVLKELKTLTKKLLDKGLLDRQQAMDLILML